MTRTVRPLVALALAGLIGLVSAGCGSHASSETGSASSAGTTSSASSSGTGDASSGAGKKLTKQEKAVKFAECMRANGVPHFPDPDRRANPTSGST